MKVADKRSIYDNVCFCVLQGEFTAIISDFALVCYRLSAFEVFLNALTSFVAEFFNSGMLYYGLLLIKTAFSRVTTRLETSSISRDTSHLGVRRRYKKIVRVSNALLHDTCLRVSMRKI